MKTRYVHLLMHEMVSLVTRYQCTGIMGAYSNADKAQKAFEKTIEDYKHKRTYVRGSEEMGGYYRIEFKKSYHYFYIQVKELE